MVLYGLYEISIHASRGGSDPLLMDTAQFNLQFQSTLPAGEATRGILFRAAPGRDFNPRFPRGKRQTKAFQFCRVLQFQSTLPAGEATRSQGSDGGGNSNFNPRFPRGKRPGRWEGLAHFDDFNPRFPRGKRRGKHARRSGNAGISIHASRGGSDGEKYEGKTRSYISIHASRGGSDVDKSAISRYLRDFNPRFPRGKRLFGSGYLLGIRNISIHASRGGSDVRKAF